MTEDTMTCLIPTGFRALPLTLSQLSLTVVLQCGQSFRWSIFPLFASDSLVPTHEYRLCLRDRVICLRQSPDTLFYRSVFPGPPPCPTVEDKREAETLAWLRDYFQLDVDLVDLYEQWARRDPVFSNCKQRFAGIRMLRQDPFENLVSFICSSNNNIARITKMVKALCVHYSPPLVTLPPPSTTHGANESATPVEAYHPFPPPSVLAAPEVSATLRTLGFGYRAEFVQKTAKMLVDAHGTEKSSQDVQEPAEKWLQTLRQISAPEAREKLLKFVGVGRKVADCILLMSLDKKEVIPVDTHVHQIAVKHYGVSGSSKTKSTMTPKLYDEVNSKLVSAWGDYAGWAHSILFTSDLKSFSSYGLPSPSPTPSVQVEAIIKGKNNKMMIALTTPPATPSPSMNKRKRRRIAKTIMALDEREDVLEASSVLPVSEEGLTMADRVKRRRRVKAIEVSTVIRPR